MSSFYPLLLFKFNTCQAYSSNPESLITCNNNRLTVGTKCTMTCSPLFWSSSSLQSSCTWRGVWTVTDFTCRSQVAAVVGIGGMHQGKWIRVTDVYPPTGSKSNLPGLQQSVVGMVEHIICYLFLINVLKFKIELNKNSILLYL
jgi:hypothetical protein